MGVSVAYISDHQQPLDGVSIATEVLELADGADLLDPRRAVHARGVRAEGPLGSLHHRLRVARGTRGRCAASWRLFHHDPSHTDEDIDRLLVGARRRGADLGLTEVIAASEGLTVSFGEAGSLGPVAAAAQ